MLVVWLFGALIFSPFCVASSSPGTVDPATAKGTEDANKAKTDKPEGGFKLDPQKLGQAIMGGLVGSALGSVSAASSMALSGGDISPADAVGHLWAGAFGGAWVGFELPATVSKDLANIDAIEDRELQKKEKDKLRMVHVKSGLRDGMMIGLVAGAFASIMSGSSDEDGSSASSASSSSSSQSSSGDKGGEGGGAAGGGGGAAGGTTNTPPAVASSANMPIIHNAIAGAAGGAIAGYFTPEIVKYGAQIGGAAIEAGKEIKSKAKDAKESIKEGATKAKESIKAGAAKAHAHVKGKYDKFQEERNAKAALTAGPKATVVSSAKPIVAPSTQLGPKARTEPRPPVLAPIATVPLQGKAKTDSRVPVLAPSTTQVLTDVQQPPKKSFLNSVVDGARSAVTAAVNFATGAFKAIDDHIKSINTDAIAAKVLKEIDDAVVSANAGIANLKRDFDAALPEKKAEFLAKMQDAEDTRNRLAFSALSSTVSAIEHLLAATSDPTLQEHIKVQLAAAQAKQLAQATSTRSDYATRLTGATTPDARRSIEKKMLAVFKSLVQVTKTATGPHREALNTEMEAWTQAIKASLDATKELAGTPQFKETSTAVVAEDAQLREQLTVSLEEELEEEEEMEEMDLSRRSKLRRRIRRD